MFFMIYASIVLLLAILAGSSILLLRSQNELARSEDVRLKAYLAAGSQITAQAATEQASTMEQINSSAGEIASQAQENAASANQANDMAVRSKDSALVGTDRMKAMLLDMQEMCFSINRISSS